MPQATRTSLHKHVMNSRKLLRMPTQRFANDAFLAQARPISHDVRQAVRSGWADRRARHRRPPPPKRFRVWTMPSNDIHVVQANCHPPTGTTLDDVCARHPHTTQSPTRVVSPVGWTNAWHNRCPASLRTRGAQAFGRPEAHRKAASLQPRQSLNLQRAPGVKRTLAQPRCVTILVHSDDESACKWQWAS